MPKPNLEDAARTVRLVTEALAWKDHARRYSAMREATIHEKVVSALSFTLECRAHSFVVPSKLSGVSRHQVELAQLVALDPLKGHRLDAQVEDGAIVVRFHDLLLGCVQRKHTGWLTPLLAHGATVHYLDVSGVGEPDRFMGLNVAFARLSGAIERFCGAGGDGAATMPDLRRGLSAPVRGR